MSDALATSPRRFDPAFADRTDIEPVRKAAAVRQADRSAIAVLRSRAEFEAIAADWQSLEAEMPGATFFQSAAWARAIFAYEEARDRAFDPVIVTLREDGRLRAVLPLQRLPGRLRILVPLGDGFAQFTDMLAAADLDPAAAAGRLLLAAIAAAPSDLISLHKVRDDGRLVAGLGKAVRTGEDQAAPFERLTDWPDFDAYFASIRTKTRKNMRSGRNRLAREGVVEHHAAEGAAETRAAVARIVQGRADRLKELGLTSRAFADPGFAGFCQGLVDTPDVEITAYSLTRNGEPLSEQWGFVHNSRYYIFMTSRDFGSSEESPGKLQMKDVMEAAFARGIETVDFMTPVMSYKQTWCRQLVPVRDYAIPVTLKGWVRIFIWDRLVRPGLKRAFMALPTGLRTGILRLTGRSLA